jgi:hypothetical protein
VIEFLVGTAAVTAGALMLIRPDGSLLAADPTVLTPTPFEDWTVPGVLLIVLVGGGFLVAGAVEWSGMPLASAVSIAAGSGLIAFEIVQLALIGWHPLQPIMMIIGAVLILLVNLRVAGNSPTRVTNLDEERSGHE